MQRQIHPDKGKGRTAELTHPLVGQRAQEMQPYGTLAHYPIALDERVRAASVEALNQILADTLMLRGLYKKHHWQASGHTFYQLHLLFDKHYAEQNKLIDALAERIQSLGGISVAVSHDVAEMTRIERPPRGREPVAVHLSRLLEAHELVLTEVRAAVKQAAETSDDGTVNLLTSDVIPTHEMQVWFLAEHLVDTSVHAE